MRARKLEKIPEGLPPPPIGRYGGGTPEEMSTRLDLVAMVDGRIWACLMDNAPFCPQEFYVWDPAQQKWLDRSVPDADPGPRVPYKTLDKLYTPRS